MNRDDMSEQELFWAGNFGREYVDRNNKSDILDAKKFLFRRALANVRSLSSAIEFGPNIGLNLQALSVLFPSIRLRGVEINERAFSQLKQIPNVEAVYSSIFQYEASELFELSVAAGVLIHLPPNKLKYAYDLLYRSSSRYIFICDYYNPVPVSVTYRGHENQLVKRDFAGEFMDIYPDVVLLDYGFRYHRDPVCPADDATWFLLKKN